MRICAVPAAAICLAMSAPAYADVLEVGDNGEARWIAGGDPMALPQTQVSPQVEQMSPAQKAALEELPAKMAVPEQAASHMGEHTRTIPAQYAAKVFELSERFDLSPSLIEALVWQESRWRANARSPVGARGLAQLMPATARELGVNPDDPMQNLEGGARYLRQQLDRFDGNLEKALAAYNAGPGRVIRAKGVPRIRETQKYVAAIMGRLSNYSRVKP
ncbi:MAG: lytic transglycosylase domain-containing protein [Erythrobacter sp.]